MDRYNNVQNNTLSKSIKGYMHEITYEQLLRD